MRFGKPKNGTVPRATGENRFGIGRYLWAFALVGFLAAVACLGVCLLKTAGRAKGEMSPLNPHQVSNLVIYDVDGLSARHLPAEVLPKITHREIDESTTRAIFREVRYQKGHKLWKGSYLATVNTADGTSRRLAMSFYGGFFVVLGEEGYYEVVGGSREILDELLRETLVATFIPARKGDGPNQER